MWGEWLPLKKLIWLHIVLGGGGGTSATVTGASPLALVNALAKPIKKLIQYGKCTTVNSETYCNNGKLVAVDDELPVEYKRQIGFKFSASTYYRIPDFHLRGTDTVRISFSADKACNVFGCYTDTSAEDNYSLYASTSSGGKYLRYDGDTYSSYIPSAQIGERLDVVITPTGTTGMPTDSVITPVEFESVADLCIGTTSASASSSKLDGNIWGSFVVDGRLTLIPCERLSDNVLGYYDLDSDTFYEPVGSAPTSLGVDSSHLTVLSVVGTPEVLMVTGEESESLPGDIVSFEVNKPSVVSALNVNVEPIQDLHGYDSPWPAGDGKNKLPPHYVGSTSSAGITRTYNADESITVQGDPTANFVYCDIYGANSTNISTLRPLLDGLTPGGPLTMTIDGNPSGIDLVCQFNKADGTLTTGRTTSSKNATTVPADAVYMYVALRVQKSRVTPPINATVRVLVGNGSTVEDYSPYSNICPISGWTSATVTRTGVNIWDEEWEVGGINSSTGQNNNETNLIRSKNYIPVKPGMAIWVQSPDQGTTPGNLRSRYYDINKQYLGMNPTMNVRASIEIPDNCYFVRFACQPYYGTSYNNDISINYPSTDHNYHPYQGNTYTIQLGDTVYGGTLDVTQGKMVVDKGYVEYDGSSDETWSKYGTGSASAYAMVISQSNVLYKANALTIQANYLKSTTPSSTWGNLDQFISAQNGNRFVTGIRTITTVADWTAYLAQNPLQVVYELATPFEITLTPTQIETFLGTNNIWADTGSIESLKYKAMQTASVENLFAVDDIKDEQNIISGTVTRRCEAVISDGTTPSGRYIGEVGDGNIIVKVRETGYEGDVATFEADSVAPLNGLTVNVEPIQDLHGYDSPWPAGGGKNKLNLADGNGTATRGITPSYDNDGGLVFTGTVSSAGFLGNYTLTNPLVLPAGTYTLSYEQNIGDEIYFLSNWTTITSIYKTATSKTITLAEETSINRICLGGSMYSADDQINVHVKHIQIESGSTATVYAPYSNICPISGRTSATVTRTGKNLLDVTGYGGTFYNAPVGTNLAQERNVVANQTIDGFDLTISLEWNGKVFSTPILPPGTYNYHVKTDSANIRGACYVTDSNFIVKRTITYVNAIGSFDAQANITKGERIAVFITSIQRETISVHDFQVEVGSSFSSYEPYHGNTYTIQLGDTVYGGTLDVTGGKMVVDRAIVDLGTLNWQYDSVANFKKFWAYGFTVIAPPPNNDEKANILCSNYKTITANKGYLGKELVGIAVVITQRLFVYDPNYSDASVFKTAMSGVQLCYELAQPFEITLTPTQIETLMGQNNVWSDTGSVKAYVADAELIEHVTAQPMRTAEGSNTVSVTSAVDPVQLEVEYVKAKD